MRRFGSHMISLIIIALLFLVFSFNTIIEFATDYQWFKELGYNKVFLTKLMTQLKLGIPSFIIVTIGIYIYLMILKKSYYKKVQSNSVSISDKRINQLALGIAAIVAFMCSITLLGSSWFEILAFMNATDFNVADPIFGTDIGFYIFKLPVLQQFYYMSIGFIVMMGIVTVLFYILMLGTRRPTIFNSVDEDELNSRRMNRSFNNKLDLGNGKQLLNIALTQLVILGVILLILIGLGYLLNIYNLMYSTRGVAYGASYTDVNVNLWIYRIMSGLSIVSALLLVVGAKRKNFKLSLSGPIIMIIVSVIGNVAAMGVQNFIVEPDELSKERKYLENNIKYTQMAYNINNVEERNFKATDTLTREDIDNNKGTIENIRINDYRPTKQFYNQSQGIRRYYQFHDVDVDRYMLNGGLTQVFLSAREMNSAEITDQWINKYLKYTHGYGVALSPVDAITSVGQPELLVKDIPPKTNMEELKIDYPQIYFGELTDDYIITNTKEKEFDYPKGNENAETFYEGDAGIKLNGINKILFAIREKSLKLVISGNIKNDSKILLYRNIKERVRKIAPFIEYDKDPYVVVADKKLYWVIDGYTISSNYPYAEPYNKNKINYIRNSVKVVIDAYNGDTKYYITDEKDPIIQTMSKVFPQLFTSVDKMPSKIKEHMRYPQTIFDIQAIVYRRYHMNNTNVFYQNEDLWDIAKEIYGGSDKSDIMESNYFIMKLPEEDQEEFLLSIPYTPKNKPNMTALLMARNDGEDYGKLILYKLPKQKNVYGPMQIESKIDQNTTISKEFSLWGQKGSSYIRGNLLIIPIENSLLYIEPIYLKADNENSLPEVKRVVVAYGDKIAYEETLKEALESLFGRRGEIPGEEIAPGELPIDGDNITLIERANEAFIRAEEAQRQGNWSEYGRYINEVKRILIELKDKK
ncbi:MAG: UPF0182 family protein [Anaeromicrobium sp.]|uniref:UPF0182 family membrane protein n=1 Tax=Anaeromicrobium sp. TaxID=1929132 RepID=UPI0025DC7515|nr:UPF0182 family protein [Anaeromicrobium sp.]MCT4592664.1 UPF0182 family protein [Anaeromicrobium sp.]